MTNPYDPSNGDSRDDNFNPYPPSQHPEDRPDFGTNPYGDRGSSLPQYGDYSSPSTDSASPNSSLNAYGVDRHGLHPTAGWPMYQGEPTGVPIGPAITYGFKETFKNGLFWILGTFIYFVVTVVLSAVEGQLSQTSGAGALIALISAAFSLAIGICAYRLAFNALDGEKLSIGGTVKGYSFPRALLVAILAGLLSFAAMLPGLILLIGSASDLLLATDTLAADADPDAVISQVSWGGFFGGMALMLLGSTLISPFISAIQLFAIDRDAGVAQSFSQGFKVVGAHYLPLLGFYIVATVICMIGILFTLGIGMVIMLPFLINATCYVFRSITGGVRPVAQ